MAASVSQQWSAEAYARNARFVADLGADVFDWLAPKVGEHILDVGCGDGALTARIADAGAVVTGVDASADLLAAAKARGLNVVLADAAAMPFKSEFDAVFSNAALHWVTDAVGAARSIHAALKPGGRFVAEFGGQGNVAAIATALRAAAQRFGGDEKLAAPWFFPSEAEYRALLDGAGFDVGRTALIPRPTPLPTGMDGWIETFRAPFFAQYGDHAGEVRDWVVQLLRPALSDMRGRWVADYVRLRVEAVAR